MIIRIDAFADSVHGISIQKKYTCEGEKMSPGITWSEVPPTTKSFALIMEDLDVPHRSNPLALWILYHIAGDVREIKTGTIPTGARLGVNDLGKAEYSAPCPEPGTFHHRYQFQLFALGADLVLPATAVDKSALTKAMKGHILATALTQAVYETR